MVSRYAKWFLLLFLFLFTGLMLGSYFGGLLFHKLWFQTSLIALAFLCFVRAVIYRIDSSFWAAVILFSFGVCGYAVWFLQATFLLGLSLHLFGLAYSSFLTFLFFRQHFHLKLFAFLLFPSIIILIYDSSLLPASVFGILLGGYAAVIIALIIFQARIQFKKV